MIVKYGEFKYIVKWIHSLPQERETKINSGFYKYECPGMTHCEIIKMNEGGTPGTEHRGAYARCSRLDQFNKNEGRKISMKRAISKFNKWERTHFWLAYAEMRGGSFGNKKRKV